MKKAVKIALVGNPNCGKTSLFNALTGLRQKVGNFEGVTVDKKTGFVSLSKDLEAEIIDLPGTYSLYPRRIDEFIAYDVMLNKQNESYPDIIVIVVDATNLKRNLLFCSQIIDLKIPVVIALNMLDIADSNNIRIDIAQLQKELGVGVAGINAREGKGLSELKKAIQETVPVNEKSFISIHSMAPEVIDEIKKLTDAKSDYTAFQFANNYAHISCLSPAQKQEIKSIIEKYQFSPAKAQGQEILLRYERISQIMSRCVTHESAESKSMRVTAKIDHLLTHPVIGYVIFLLIFFIVFQAIFSWATYPMDWINAAFIYLGNTLHKVIPDGWVSSLLIEGVLAGIGGVAVFIPQIMLLFGFITLLEDTGYMARVSFLMDRLMRGVGLGGKSTVPLISGLACAVPAIMSTRNIENWKERIITIMVTPLQSCSARLPVYTLLVGFAVPDQNVLGIFNLQGLAMLGLYLLGFLMAMLAALIMKILIKTKDATHFVMELPIYRTPRWSNVGVTMIEKAKVFVTEAGRIIVAISVVLWFLASFGPGNEIKKVEEKYQQASVTAQFSPQEIENKIQSEKLTHSYAGHLGRWIEPAIAPMGFDWKIGISLITAFAAREVFVGTMATIYSVGSSQDPDFSKIRERMQADINPKTGERVYSRATAISLMIFFAFAMQCMSTVAVVHRETKSWKWPLIQIFYMTALAYVASTIVYQLLK